MQCQTQWRMPIVIPAYAGNVWTFESFMMPHHIGRVIWMKPL